MRYAEVIGSPIKHSKSPIIHKYWLDQLGLSADYRRTLVVPCELGEFLRARQSDLEWRGCNVTIPLKEEVLPHLNQLDPISTTVRAANCVVPRSPGLVGYNTDVDGVAAALDDTALEERKAVVIGAGGGGGAVLTYLTRRKVGRITILVRNVERAERLRLLVTGVDFQVLPFDSADGAMRGVAAIINSSPLGMASADRMPHPY